MAQLLETNAQGRPILTRRRARELAAIGSAGSWYIAPFATQWTIGLLSAYDHGRYHVLDEEGEPLGFEYEWDAWEYLRRELKVPNWNLPPAPQKLVPQSALYPTLAHLLIERGARSGSLLEHRRK